MSNFQSDLINEQILAEYLDSIYYKLNFETQRVTDFEHQKRGVDIIITNNNIAYYIDEKSQLYYLNKELPTFAFELSYLKKKTIRQGWLLDKKKQTDYYFLVTSIILNEKMKTLKSKSDIESLKITSVNRKKLIQLLSRKLIDFSNLEYDIYNIREAKAFGKHAINGLDGKTQGNIYFTENLAEQPINLVLKLDYLVKMGVAKTIYSQT